MTREEKAVELFSNGYNCAQAVIGAFADDSDVDLDSLLKIGSSLGGGVGRTGEICGALNGAAIMFGLLRGMEGQPSSEDKQEFAGKTAVLLGDFKSEFGCVRCADLLEVASEDKRGYCENLVISAVRMLEKQL